MTLNYYIENDVKLLKWPPYSPDLNPIENIWGAIKNKLAGRSFKSIEYLKSEIKENWSNWKAEN